MQPTTEKLEDLDQYPVMQQTAISEMVPVIDVSELIINPSSSSAARAVDEIANACRSWGFFQVVNHDVDKNKVHNVWQQTKALFDLSLDEKMSFVRSKENPWGFYNNELTKNQRDKKEVFDFTREGTDPIYGQSNQWPSDKVAGHEEIKNILQQHFADCTKLSLTLLEAFCVGLDLPSRSMHEDFATNHTGFLRLNYYPVNDPMQNLEIDHQEVADLGVHHHTDAGALTVLMQDDVGGLQVYKDGYWHDIPTIENAFVINTGDMMQVWSNDRYQAPIHRVLAMQSFDRYSLPFFFNPAASANVSPLSTVVSELNPSRYHSINWAEFRGKRTDGDYADFGTEVQISQYRK